MALQYAVFPVTGNANGLVSGSVIAGSSINVGDSVRTKLKSITALVSFTAATATLTATVKWQVSNDNSVWVDIVGSSNATSVVLATGTSAIVTKAIDAPAGILGWRWARAVIVTGVATGASGDLYSISYSQRTSRSLDG
jgi:hypothetical protein